MKTAGVSFLIRALAIDRRLRKKPYPNLEELIECVQNARDGTSISTRTVQLDLQVMREHAGIRMFAPIIYDRRRNHYRYSEKNYTIINALMNA